MDPRVLDAMMPFFTDMYGNPHSRTHSYGWEAEHAVDDARRVSVTLLWSALEGVIALLSDERAAHRSARSFARL